MFVLHPFQKDSDVYSLHFIGRKSALTLLVFILHFAFANQTKAQGPERIYEAKRTNLPIKIDGIRNDEAWASANTGNGFRQYTPVENADPTQETEMFILYDDEAIYFAAEMHDSCSDSICKELGARDAEELNADKVRFVIDPYNTRQDGYLFEVYASGVQADSKFSDYSFNTVWQSAVQVHDHGWTCEMKIPWSSIRFPDKEEQEFALQVARDIRRNFEYLQWSPVPRNAANVMNHFGTLKGIKNVKPPLRLSLMPYLSSYYTRAPLADGSGNIAGSFRYNFGADLKYGIDERFTLDMTLLPDFGQTTFDNKVKNLGYSEVVYNENRTFFQEGLDLFSKGNLFYTRRIGRVPTLYYNVPYMLNPGDVLISNPSQTRLLNAAKFSGRSNSGLGIGVFNAITAEMNAVVEDSLGNQRKIMTEPKANYNIVVFDQQLKNNSFVYLINTNVLRDNYWKDGNVTGVGTTLNTKSNNFSFDGGFALSQIYTVADTAEKTHFVQAGHKWFLGVRKNGGIFNYGYSNSLINRNWEGRDLGYFTVRDYMNNRVYLTINKNKPSWKIRQAQLSLIANQRQQISTSKLSDLTFSLDTWAFLTNFWTVYAGGNTMPISPYDYNEPRIPGMYYRAAEYWVFWIGFESDARKKIMGSLTFTASDFYKKNQQDFPLPVGYFPEARIRYRFSNRLSVSLSENLSYDPYNPGFASFDEFGNPVLGGRKVTTWTTSLTGKYVFNPKLSMNFTLRHYWSAGKYIDYFLIGENGQLVEYENYPASHDFNYNAFNIDANIIWQFAPGSFLTLNYKKTIENESYGFITIPRFGENMQQLFQAPGSDIISLRGIWYFDVNKLRRS